MFVNQSNPVRPVFRFPIPALNSISEKLLSISVTQGDILQRPWVATHEAGHVMAELALGKPVHGIIIQPHSFSSVFNREESTLGGSVISSLTVDPLNKIITALGGEVSNDLFTYHKQAKFEHTAGAAGDMLRVIENLQIIGGYDSSQLSKLKQNLERAIRNQDTNAMAQSVNQTLVIPLVEEIFTGLKQTFRQANTNTNNGIVQFITALIPTKPIIGTPETIYFIAKNFGVKNWLELRKASKQHLLPVIQKYKLK